MNRTLTNCNFKLYEEIQNLNPPPAKTSQIDSAVEDIANKFQEALSAISTSVIIDPYKGYQERSHKNEMATHPRS